MTRRRALALSAGAVGATFTASVATTMFDPDPPGPRWPPFVLDLGGVTVTALHTGSVAVKAAHREWAGPAALAAIVADPRWTGWLPITAWLVEHADGPVVVDTGETPRVAEDGYFACDPGLEFFYRRQLRFDVPHGLAAALEAEGVPPADVRTVVLTHTHSDHAGGLADVPNAAVWTSRTEAEHPAQGAVRCRWPDGFRPTPTDYRDGPAGAFDRSHALTPDGAVRLVPTPGHTRGHQSVIVEGETGSAFLAGDASFSLGQVRRRAPAGICEDRDAARRTLDVVAEHLDATGARYLATHEPVGVDDV